MAMAMAMPSSSFGIISVVCLCVIFFSSLSMIIEAQTNMSTIHLLIHSIRIHSNRKKKMRKPQRGRVRARETRKSKEYEQNSVEKYKTNTHILLHNMYTLSREETNNQIKRLNRILLLSDGT